MRCRANLHGVQSTVAKLFLHIAASVLDVASPGIALFERVVAAFLRGPQSAIADVVYVTTGGEDLAERRFFDECRDEFDQRLTPTAIFNRVSVLPRLGVAGADKLAAADEHRSAVCRQRRQQPQGAGARASRIDTCGSHLAMGPNARINKKTRRWCRRWCIVTYSISSPERELKSRVDFFCFFLR